MATEVLAVIIRLKAEWCAYATDSDLDTQLVYVTNGKTPLGAILKEWVDTVIPEECSDGADLEWWVLV